MRATKFSLVIIVVFISLIVVVRPVLALNVNSPVNNQTNQGTSANINTSSSGKPLLHFTPPVTGGLGELRNRLVNIAFGLIASVALIFIIVGGFRLAFSQGNAEAVTQGKKTITWAIVGLVVAILAFAIVRIVVKLLY